MIGLPNSLRGRLLSTAAVFIALALVATGLAVNFALHRFVQGQIDQRLDGQLITMTAALEPGPDGRIVLARNVDSPPFDNPGTGWFWLVRTPTHVWLAGGLRSADVELPPVPAGVFAHPLTLDGSGPNGRKVRARAGRVRIEGQEAVLIAAAPYEALNGPLRDALVPLFTALVVLGTGLVLATLLQVRLGLRPLDALRDRIAAVRTGAAEKLPTDQPDEVRPLVVEINTLLDQHAANLERARRHVANLAHALKTPLASLTLALHEPQADPENTLRPLAVAMDRQIRHHLARARVAALGSAGRSSVPLTSRVKDHIDAFAKIYAEKGVQCHVRLPTEVAVACDAQDVDEMVGNLLDNAFKWTRSAVWVTAEAENRQVRFTVEDDGPGIDADCRGTLLQRGRRLDETVPGHGFGLAIVNEIVELYGGTFNLSDRPPHGLKAMIELPQSLPAPESAGASDEGPGRGRG